jgi:NADH-quinone oxidoreductase subunit B
MGSALGSAHYPEGVLASFRARSALRLAADPGLGIDVIALGLACCAVEVDAAVAAGLLRPEEAGDDPARARILVVAGTVTTPLAPVLEAAVHQGPTPDAVLAFGACASTGGPYWDSPTVVNGADMIVPVDEYVPGCPPRPEALCRAVAELASRVAAP